MDVVFSFNFFKNSSLSFFQLSSIYASPFNFINGILVIIYGLQTNSHYSMNIPGIYDKKLKENITYSPGFITFEE